MKRGGLRHDRTGEVDAFSAIRSLVRGFQFSLFGVPAHKVFIVNLRQTDLAMACCRNIVKELKNFILGVSAHRLTFFLRTRGYLVGADGSGGEFLRVSSLTPAECLSFVSSDRWPNDVRQSCRAALLGGRRDGSRRDGALLYDKHVMARELWMRTLGQPIALKEFLSVAVENDDATWSPRIRMIEDIVGKEQTRGAIAFLYVLALVADAESVRTVDPVALAKACGLENQYEKLVELLRCLHGFDLGDRYDVKLFEIVKPDGCRFDGHVFKSECEASAFLLKCGKFGEAGKYAYAMARVNVVLSESSLKWEEDDYARMGKNLARAIVKCRQWNEWESSRKVLDDALLKNCSVVVQRGFESELTRLKAEHSLLSRLRKVHAAMESNELLPVLRSAIKDCETERDFLSTLFQALQIADFAGIPICDLGMDLELVRRSLRASKDMDLSCAVISLTYLMLCYDMWLFKDDGRNRRMAAMFSDLRDELSSRMSRRNATIINVAFALPAHVASNDALDWLMGKIKGVDVTDSVVLSDVVAKLLYTARDYSEAEGECDAAILQRARAWFSRHVNLTGYDSGRLFYSQKVGAAFSASDFSLEAVLPRLETDLRPAEFDLNGQAELTLNVLRSLAAAQPQDKLSVLSTVVSRQQEWMCKMNRDVFKGQFYTLAEIIGNGCEAFDSCDERWKKLSNDFLDQWRLFHHDGYSVLSWFFSTSNVFLDYLRVVGGVSKLCALYKRPFVCDRLVIDAGRILCLRDSEFSDDLKGKIEREAAEVVDVWRFSNDAAELLYVTARAIGEGECCGAEDNPDLSTCIKRAMGTLEKPFLRASVDARPVIRIDSSELAFALCCVTFVAAQSGDRTGAEVLAAIGQYLVSPSGNPDNEYETVQDYISSDWTNAASIFKFFNCGLPEQCVNGGVPWATIRG